MPNNILKQYDDAWLGLGDLGKLKVDNEFMRSVSLENIGMDSLRFMRDPKNFALTAKVFFDLDLLPIQSAILEELWIRPFPMYIASRGFGKSWLIAVYAMLKLLLVPETKIVIVGAAFRQSKIIFEYMEQIWHNADICRSVCGTGRESGPRRDVDRCTMYMNGGWAIAVPLGTGEKIRGLRAHTIIGDEFSCLDKNTLIETNQGLERIGDVVNLGYNKTEVINKNGEFELPHKYIKTPPTKVFEVITKHGYRFKCSENHKMLTTDGWKSTKELSVDDYIISDNKYVFPSKTPYEFLNEDMAWLLGLLVSEGTVTNKNYVGITTTDYNLVSNIRDKFGYLNPKVYERPAYNDDRGWKCKQSYEIRINNTEFRHRLYLLGLDFVRAYEKKIPFCILRSPKNIVIAFLKGLFYGDGSCFAWFCKNTKKNRLGVSYYTVSPVLAQDVQTLLLKIDIISNQVIRSSKISDKPQYMLRCNGTYALCLVNLLNIDEWNDIVCSTYTHIPSDDYGVTYDKSRHKWKVGFTYAGKVQNLGRYCNKAEALNVVKNFFEVNPRCFKVNSVTLLKNKDTLYDLYLPQTHSFYGNGFVQHNSIPPDIYETVVAGFAAVSASPVANVKEAARRAALTKAGVWTADAEHKYQDKGGNQAIISGTASYGFQHFADYWRRYRDIINSKGDSNKLRDLFEMDEMPEDFNWRDYSIIRIPYELIPKGFMDDRQIMRAKATVHSAIYAMEYGAVFSDDSDGFFKRSLVESCVASYSNIQKSTWPKWCPNEFDALVRGSGSKEYIYGVDPASEQDNFSIIILELHQEHTRIVYSWTTTRKDFKARLKAGLAKDHDFYGFCARKIRDLMKVFPCKAIALDAQGGGIAIEEALHDPGKIEAGEVPIWPVIDDEKEKDTDIESGLHILHLCQFAKADWTADANHGLRKDFEDKILLFPRFDPATLELSIEEDKRRKTAFDQLHPDQKFNIYDTLEDCVMELEELKDELATIQITKTGTGVNSRDRWDTPEIKLPNGKKGRMRKDRYSSLVMANMIARTIQRMPSTPDYAAIGGAVGSIAPSDKGQLYMGPAWFVNGMEGGVVCGVSRK